MSVLFAPSRTRASPASRRPDPASKITLRPPQRTSTQAVLPPPRNVSGPAVGMLPRHSPELDAYTRLSHVARDVAP